MLFHELEKLVKLPPFKGIPQAEDFIPYSNAYYKVIEQSIFEKHGKSATMLDANAMMREFGNTAYFNWFPDIFKTTEESLGEFYQPSLPIIESEFTDYIHGLTHIRSRSEHTFLGEILAVPDNSVCNGAGYGFFLKFNRDIPIQECNQTLFDLFNFQKHKTHYKNKLRINIIKNSYFFQNEENVHYQIYHKEHFKKDIPTKAVRLDFLTNYTNSFEKRLAQNTVRAIYTDVKFKEFGSQKKFFIDTAPADSCRESYTNLFTSEEEDAWISKIFMNLNKPSQLQQIVNTTSSKDTYPQKLAALTIQEIEYFNLIKEISNQ